MSIVEELARPAVFLERRPDGVTRCGPRKADRHPVSGADDIAALMDAIDDDTVLVVDDLDLLPYPVLEPLLDAFRSTPPVLLAAMSPRHVVASSGGERWEALRPMFDQSAAVAIPLPPLSLRETAELSDTLRTARYGAERADDAWQMALHHLSGGSPALVREIVEAAAARGRLHALLPIDPQSDALPGAVVASATKMLAPLDARDRRVLAALAELGPVPHGHLGSIVPADVLARLHDGGLLSAGADASTAAVSGVISRMVGDSSDLGDLGDERRELARELLLLARQASWLTPGEQKFCARWAETGHDPSLETALARILPRAALALARSSSPREALPVAERVLARGVDATALSALIVARVALGEYAEAERLLDQYPAPTTKEERDGALHLHVGVLFATSAGADAALERLRELVGWAPDDEVWRLRVECSVNALSLSSGSAPDLPGDLAARAEGADEETISLAEACQAAVEASRGNSDKVHELLRRRQQTHGMDVESNVTVFRLHAFALMMLGEDLDLVQRATRRRLLVARWEDRQDDVAMFALTDASIQLIRGRTADVHLSLGLIDVSPPESTRIWIEIVRAAALVLDGDLVHAAAAIERIDAVSEGWGRGGFGAVRDTVCALLDAASRRPLAAASRAERALSQAQRTVPLLVPALLRLQLQGGATAEEVLERAEDISADLDIAPLRAFIDELRAMTRRDVARLDVLTAREREVVQLAAAGFSNSEIAARLTLSVRTVESHLHHARTRLGMGRYERFSSTAGSLPAGSR
ncbi:hypothetical protein NS220_07720 [Microbacterium testaceum]|uniref:HTH luxR-type domain-containing protein n=1 Tax=Microbacterium testaceum TaxID=2033 RepID=A0A147EY24_MICTE|nr:LuxR family transcriptional regulator [Microbacterium testaceum]KTR94892.1 hypothetical protein NS220_07720 [Microbacterium testaceum]